MPNLHHIPPVRVPSCLLALGAINFLGSCGLAPALARAPRFACHSDIASSSEGCSARSVETELYLQASLGQRAKDVNGLSSIHVHASTQGVQ